MERTCLVATLLLGMVSGCIKPIPSATFDETMDAAPPVENGRARCVFYFPADTPEDREFLRFAVRPWTL